MSNTTRKSATTSDAASISTCSMLSEKEKAQDQFGGRKQSKTSRLIESMNFPFPIFGPKTNFHDQRSRRSSLLSRDFQTKDTSMYRVGRDEIFA